MQKPYIRLSRITINDFKNVRHGSIDLRSKNGFDGPSIVGLYGQNGSGKTALIDTLSLLNDIVSHYNNSIHYEDLICVEANCSSFIFEFDVLDDFGSFKVIYETSIRGEQMDPGLDRENRSGSGKRLVVFNERVKYSYISKDGAIKKKLNTAIDTDTNRVFSPQKKYDTIFGKDKSLETDLLVAKGIAGKTSKSFVFSGDFIKRLSEEAQKSDENTEAGLLFRALFSVWEYVNHNLFVFDTKGSGLLSLDRLPLSYYYPQDTRTNDSGILILSLDSPTLLSEQNYALVNTLINNMNGVLNQIVPGLILGIKRLGQQLLESGQTGVLIELTSKKNSKEIPLRNESDGIKKIIAVLQLLIVFYNYPSITVAIDELDSGVFEYLFGELLRVLADGGKGQLIFTSHNLRPLETIDKSYIAFTTTNPDNCYIQLENVKSNNNLRSFYFRDIVVGEQKEETYAATNNSEIAYAFRKAGNILGS